MDLFLPNHPSLECLKALGHMEMAAESYTKVVHMATLHLEARLSLATLQQQLGRPEHALKALESMYDSETLARDSSAAQKVKMCVCPTHFLYLCLFSPQGFTTFAPGFTHQAYVLILLLMNHLFTNH